MKCRIPAAVPPPGGTGTDLELDLKWRGSEDAVRVWCVARAVQPSFGDFPDVAVALAGAGSRVEGLVAVAYDPLGCVEWGSRGEGYVLGERETGGGVGSGGVVEVVDRC